MAKIKTLKDSEGNSFYPQTHTKGIVDDNGNNLEVILSEQGKQLDSKIAEHSTVRFHRIEENETTINAGEIGATPSAIVYYKPANKFVAADSAGNYWDTWEGLDAYMDGNTIHKNKLYICGGQSYTWDGKMLCDVSEKVNASLLAEINRATNAEETLLQLINSIKPVEYSGTVVNAPDEEDITEEDNMLKLMDRPWGNGMGYVILRKSKPLQEQLINENTIYEVRYNFDLGGEEINVPNNCTLKFDGGYFSNGIITGNNTVIKAGLIRIFNTNITLFGSWNVVEAYPEWFGASVDNTKADNTAAITAVVNNDVFQHISFKKSLEFESIIIGTSDKFLDFFHIKQYGRFTIGSVGSPVDNIYFNNPYLINRDNDSNCSLITVHAKDFYINNPIIEGGGNGAISVNYPSSNGIINNPIIKNACNVGVRRAIWLNGIYNEIYSELVDKETFERNSITIPDGSVSNITINNPIIEEYNGYGIYLMNTRNTLINNPRIKIANGVGFRNIAVNNYNENTQIKGGLLQSGDVSNTGILCTQCSKGTIIENVKFKGDFGGNRAIYCQYLSETKIQGCDFTEATGTQNIQVNTNAKVSIKDCRFKPTVRAIYITDVDSSFPEEGSLCYSYAGFNIKNNHFDLSCKNTQEPCIVISLTALNGNTQSKFEYSSIKNNLVENPQNYVFGKFFGSSVNSTIDIYNSSCDRSQKQQAAIQFFNSITAIGKPQECVMNLNTYNLEYSLSGADITMYPVRAGKTIQIVCRTNQNGGTGSIVPNLFLVPYKDFQLSKEGNNYVLSSESEYLSDEHEVVIIANYVSSY